MLNRISALAYYKEPSKMPKFEKADVQNGEKAESQKAERPN